MALKINKIRRINEYIIIQGPHPSPTHEKIMEETSHLDIKLMIHLSRIHNCLNNMVYSLKSFSTPPVCMFDENFDSK